MSSSSSNYKNLIFTNHAQDRFKSRGISNDLIYLTIKNPDRKEQISHGKIKFFRTINNRKIQVIATYRENEQKWLVISAWVRGEDDKIPFVWQLISLPFRFFWWLIKNVIILLIKYVKR